MRASWRWLQTLPQVCLFLTAVSLLMVAELSKAHFERLMQEDGWAEWATFCAFLLAAGLLIRVIVRRSVRSLEGLVALGLALFSGFVAGEEISWGQRLLGYMPPALFLEHNYQQESNLHNLLKDVVDTRFMVCAVSVSYGVLAPYLALVTRFPAALAAPLGTLPWFALIAWLEFSYPYELVGELAELLLGLAFLYDACERAQRDTASEAEGRARGYARATFAQVAVLAAACGLVPLNDLVARLSAPELVAHTKADLSRLARQIADGLVINEKLFAKREVHKRMHTAVRAGYLELERDRYYLDAWNSPYWIAFVRTGAQRGRVSLYSFGPNRRRDLRSTAPRARTAGGDDVYVSVEVSRPARAQR